VHHVGRYVQADLVVHVGRPSWVILPT
jgi:hypothetical protein